MIKKWEFKGAAANQFLIDDEDVFKEQWINTGEEAEVKDPLYGNKRIFTVCLFDKNTFLDLNGAVSKVI